MPPSALGCRNLDSELCHLCIVGIASAAVVVAATVFFALETHTVYCMPKNHALTVDPKFLS
jgi:hypothetical protein